MSKSNMLNNGSGMKISKGGQRPGPNSLVVFQVKVRKAGGTPVELVRKENFLGYAQGDEGL